ncbi:murein L,D-transpeptidase [Pseudoruegeria sp. SK021]|uniref:L,D-transpeptidase family protein n=1 Tax=Pseudoruegeria sp. SK021 TaxID=1933035 RepID=UPI000A265B7E|nr:L,D-transpeptidase family protein [Pseudoruegeria sp. SK021]OSP55293.1 murein L,D-transpeptidase [Pseudoruegeria sp. SK021]
MTALFPKTSIFRIVAAFVLSLSSMPAFAQGADVALRQAIAAEVSSDPVLTTFYEGRGYAPFWVGDAPVDEVRLRELMIALDGAGYHGLPVAAYDPGRLSNMVRSARTVADQGRADAILSRAFLDYAQDVQSGVLNPVRVNDEIKRTAPRRDPLTTLTAFESSVPSAFLKALPPQSANYARLMADKIRLERLIDAGGWGETVPGTKMEYGQSGPQIVALRNRLIAMGYANRSPSASFDDALRSAVAAFQGDHGLLQDGVVGPGTLGELNTSAEARLQQVIVAMERERWMNFPLGDRYIWVNIPDFHVRIIDNGRTTFETRSVVGQNQSTHRTPEFSDVMEYIVVNPTWNVPRSITTREYLPMLQANPNAVSHLQLLDTNGTPVDRTSIDFTSYTARTFPFRLKEPPSDGNALGKVKFMFPNANNIYLHDTPSKSLFAREQRAYSHGCIRLGDPMDFAHALLARQSDKPEALMQAKLNTNRETVVNLEQSVPVHLVYQTAFTQAKGPIQFRRDVYGRDQQIFDALARAGVSLRAVGG